MGFHRAILSILVPILVLSSFSLSSLGAQDADRIWGRVRTVSGDVHEGFIRWDRNEASWVDLLDGTKEFVPFEYVDWWDLAHPGDRGRDRVLELAGYRISWDDNEPEFPSSVESGIRFGHISRLTPLEDQLAELELRSGEVVEFSGGSTDLGTDLREILVTDSRGRTVELEWEDLETVEFFPSPADARPTARRLHGTVEMQEDRAFTGFLSWDVNQVLASDTLNGEDSDGRRRDVLFHRISEVRPDGDGAEITLTDGTRMDLSGDDDVDDGNDGILVSDPALGFVDVDWEDIVRVRFHDPVGVLKPGALDGGRRLRGTVLTTDSTELTGWIRWDGDEEYSWELLDGRSEGVGFDIEFNHIAAIGKVYSEITSINLGPTGMAVSHPFEEGTQVTLLDGRVFELSGSNDVDESNHGIFVLEEGSGQSPENEEAQWVMVRWEDFLEVRFDWSPIQVEVGR